MLPEISVIREVGLLDRHLSEWDAFHRRWGRGAPFCGPRVWVPWLKAFGQYKPEVYEFRQNGNLRALLPMFRSGEKLETATGPHLDYQDVTAVNHEAAVALLLGVIHGERGHHPSLLTFPNVKAYSRLECALGDPRIETNAHVQCRFMTVCATATFIIPSNGDFLAALSSRQRKDYRAAAKKIAAAAPANRVEHWGPGGIPDEAFESAAVLHRENQHRKAGDSIFNTPGYIEFLRGQSAAGAPICLSLLREEPGGPPMAFNIGYFGDDTFFYYLTSYAGRHAECSPGRWLMVDSLNHWSRLVENGTLRFDMLGGEESYKARWADSSYPVSRVVLIPRGLGGFARVVAYSTVYGLKGIKNRLLGRDAVNLARPATEPGDIALPR